MADVITIVVEGVKPEEAMLLTAKSLSSTPNIGSVIEKSIYNIIETEWENLHLHSDFVFVHYISLPNHNKHLLFYVFFYFSF